MVFIREAGGEFSLCVRFGGVGKTLGRSLEAALRSATDGSREERFEARAIDRVFDCVGDGGEVAGWDGGSDCRPSRWTASLDAFSRTYLRWASMSPGRVALTSTRRTSVGEPTSNLTVSDGLLLSRFEQQSTARRSFIMTASKVMESTSDGKVLIEYTFS